MNTFQEDIIQLHQNNQTPKEESMDFPECRGMTFKEFWGWMNKNSGQDLEFHDYWQEMYDDLKATKHLWVKKCAGIGMTEFMLRWISWNCLKDDVWKNQQIDVNIVLIVGPRLDLAITIIQRLKDMFPEGGLTKTKEDKLILNGNKMKAYPSHHVASAHGLNPLIVWDDEGDFFPTGQQDKVREVNERYIAKTNPYLIWTSTAYLPGGLYEQIEDEPEDQCIYLRRFLLLDRALASGHYTQQSIVKWRLSPSFMREAYGHYGYGIGDIFAKFVDDKIMSEYDTSYLGGEVGTYADPGWGSSHFGLVTVERRGDTFYVLSADEYIRDSPNRMVDEMQTLWNIHQQSCKVDAANTAFIRSLTDKGIPALGIAFGEQVIETEGNNTTVTLKKKMPVHAGVMASEGKVKVHPKFKKLISQMRAVKFDKMGGIDKSEISFDLIDAIDMALWDLKEHDYSSIGLKTDGTIYGRDRPKSKSVKVQTQVIE